MAQTPMTVTEAAKKLEEIGEAWIGNGSGQTLDQVLLDAASSLSPDPIFNLAAFLRFQAGDSIAGESDIEVIQSAMLMSRILGDKRWQN